MTLSYHLQGIKSQEEKDQNDREAGRRGQEAEVSPAGRIWAASKCYSPLPTSEVHLAAWHHTRETGTTGVSPAAQEPEFISEHHLPPTHKE